LNPNAKLQMSNEFQMSNIKMKASPLSFDIDLKFAMNHVRFMICPELYVVQETLTFDMQSLSKDLRRKGKRDSKGEQHA